MKNNILTIIAIFYIATIIPIYGQSTMGAWRTHISYTSATQLTQSNDFVYAINNGALFSIKKDNPIIKTYSKIDGLNDNNIRFIKYAKSNELLLIVYNNSNIDLLTDDGTVINVTDLYKKSMSDSKKINDICIIDEFAYLACDFGIVLFNITKQEFVETYIIGDEGETNKILNIEINNGNIYALTTDNIYVAPLTTNLLNYQNWIKISNPNTDEGNITMTIENDILYLLKKDNIVYQYSKQIWKNFKTSIQYIYNDNGMIFLTNKDNTLTVISDDYSNFVANNAITGIYDNLTNTIWYLADGIVYSYAIKKDQRNLFVPNGPLNNTSWRLKYSNGRIFSVPGGRWSLNYYTNASLSFFENGIWNNYTAVDFVNNTETDTICYDLVDIAIDPNDNTHFWVASYGLGLYEFRNDQIYKHHHCDNSGLKSIYQDDIPKKKYNYIRIDGMTYDENGNLWLLNNAGSLIKYIDKNGIYHNIDHAVKASTPQDIIINNKNQNQKIIFIPRTTSNTTSQIFAFDDNGTIDNIYDDKTITLTKVYDQDNKEINFCGSANLRSIAQDKNGTLWVGTTEGLFLINDPSKMFENDFNVHRIKIARNDDSGLADYLLGTEEIKTIAIDGANRKWIGTASSGVYLVSEDGQEIIHHFTTENSPLLSDVILSIAINDKTGEVFIGTGGGLISYQSDAVEAFESFENIHAFPNPVRPEYNGTISIIGLTENSIVRITDINGNLIYETISNGGIATWNGCKASGDRVATGVYFAHCISANGKQKHITKILIIK